MQICEQQAAARCSRQPELYAVPKDSSAGKWMRSMSIHKQGRSEPIDPVKGRAAMHIEHFANVAVCTQVTSQELVREKRSEQLSMAQMSMFSLAARSAPSRCHPQRKSSKHAHSTARLLWHREHQRPACMSTGLSTFSGGAVWCSTGQVQSALQSSCCSSARSTEQVPAEQSSQDT